VHVTHCTAPSPSQPLKAEPAGNRHNAAHGELEQMGTMAIVDLKRRTEEELEKRSWAKALANLDTVIPEVASVARARSLPPRDSREGDSAFCRRIWQTSRPPSANGWKPARTAPVSNEGVL